jgi:hypothetical protein
MALSISDIIGIVRISGYLAQNDVQKGSLFGAMVSPLTPKVLYVTRKSIEYIYDLDPTDENLSRTTNYLYSLCRGYNLKAQGLLSQIGGGSVSSVSPATAPSPIQFEVSGSTAISAGATSGTISSFIGYNLIFVRGGIPQTTVNQGGGATYYSWDKDLGLLTVSPSAQAGELFQLYPI